MKNQNKTPQPSAQQINRNAFAPLTAEQQGKIRGGAAPKPPKSKVLHKPK